VISKTKRASICWPFFFSHQPLTTDHWPLTISSAAILRFATVAVTLGACMHSRVQGLTAMRSVALLLLAGLAGCTTIGVHTSAREEIDYGQPATVRVCLLRAADIPPRRAEALHRIVRKEFEQYGLLVEVPWVREWQRPGFQAGSIMDDLLQRPLEPPCDRLFGLVDRHLGDFVWGLVLPEVLGAVESVTATRGFVVATWGSVNQIFAAPETRTKRTRRRARGSSRYFLATRAEADAAIAAYFAAEEKRKAGKKPRKDGRDY
jgi:hypothetical protein